MSVSIQDIEQLKGFPISWGQLPARVRFWESQFMFVSFQVLRIIKVVIVSYHLVYYEKNILFSLSKS